MAPLERGKLVGRRVMIPRSFWPDEPCHEPEGEGWPAAVVSESHGVVGIKTLGYACQHFRLEVVLEWRPLR